MYDTIIIGAGPAGLSAARRLITSKRDIKIMVVEQGVDFSNRDHNIVSTVASGFGGAGLFTDGKLSLPPSSSFIWSSLDKEYVKQSYNSVRTWLQGYEVDLPKFDNRWFISAEKKYEGEKIYHSEKLNLEKSESIIEGCEALLKRQIHLNSEVKHITKKVVNNQSFYEVAVDSGVFQTRNLIVATGKIGSSHLLTDFNFNSDYIAEAGVRIEVPNDIFIYYNSKQLDYKVIKHKDDYEIRTFCCCKDGSVVKSTINGYTTFNGMITEDHTGKSNIGIIVRSKKGGVADKILSLIRDKKIKDGKISLLKYVDGTEEIYGNDIDNIFINTIKEIVIMDRIKEGDSIVYYPAVEKLGDCCNDFSPSSLKLKNENIWICGDATYKFRGLLAAFISGEIAAREILDGFSNKVYIKESSVELTKVVFTAQSKEFFYCKDVICQYVLNNNATPINPFQIFNYFLNDRVSRDLIRRGNNNLIMRCDELWVFGKISDGVLFEIKLAKDNGKPIKFFTIGTYERDISPIDIDHVKFDSEVHAKQIKRKDLLNFLRSDIMDEQDPLIKQIDMFSDFDLD